MSSARLLSFVLIMMIALQAINPARSTSNNRDQQNNRGYSPMLFDRLGVDPPNLLTNRVFEDEDPDNGMIVHQKRQLRKKWAKLYQDSHSPYKIAFPALIRSRRSTGQDQQIENKE